MRRIATTPRLILAIVVLTFGLPLVAASCSWLFCCNMDAMGGPSPLAAHCTQEVSGSAMSCCDSHPAAASALPAANVGGSVQSLAAPPVADLALVPIPASLDAVLPAALRGSPAPCLFLLHASLLI